MHQNYANYCQLKLAQLIRIPECVWMCWKREVGVLVGKKKKENSASNSLKKIKIKIKPQSVSTIAISVKKKKKKKKSNRVTLGFY